jgi:hypothetical protein
VNPYRFGFIPDYPSDSFRNVFRLCRFLAAGWRWNFNDHRIILEKPLLDVLPLGGWDHPRPPGNACGFVVLGHDVAEVVEYSDSGGAVGFLKMKLRSRLVYFCHEEFVMVDGRTSPAGYKSFRVMPLCRTARPREELEENLQSWGTALTCIGAEIARQLDWSDAPPACGRTSGGRQVADRGAGLGAMMAGK